MKQHLRLATTLAVSALAAVSAHAATPAATPLSQAHTPHLAQSYNNQTHWDDDASDSTDIAVPRGRSGDAAYMDEDGFIFIVDRKKDMIVSGGENVYSAEVENALSRHPAVLECAVIGIPHEQWGGAVHAELRLRDGCEIDEEALNAHCAELIAGYKRPRSYNFRKEPLPLSAAGKVLKNELRKVYWDGRERSIA